MESHSNEPDDREGKGCITDSGGKLLLHVSRHWWKRARKGGNEALWIPEGIPSVWGCWKRGNNHVFLGSSRYAGMLG